MKGRGDEGKGKNEKRGGQGKEGEGKKGRGGRGGDERGGGEERVQEAGKLLLSLQENLFEAWFQARLPAPGVRLVTVGAPSEAYRCLAWISAFTRPSPPASSQISLLL